MVNPVARAAFAASQTARVGWYFGQYMLAARLSPVYTPPPVVGATQAPGAADILRDIRALFRRDLANIEAGYYRMPHDMVQRPDALLRGAARFFADLPRVSRRRETGEADSVPEPADSAVALPDYYLQNFHFQSDGWLSEHSAKLYDYQVEVLFGGAADAMRRQALVAVADLVRRRGERLKLLDVATGTGRFLTFLRQSYPGIAVTGVDLSPHYLAEARRRLRPFGGARLLEGKAEDLPVAEASQDVVTCVYLFHELPHEVRERAIAEFARVLAPGGRVILVDSLQTGDRPFYDGLLARFPHAFHEPYYADYIARPLIPSFRRAGLTYLGTLHAFLSKVMVFEKAG
jgi:ubiquinone/menaquinone biosynthesis C-methylase UbiE